MTAHVVADREMPVLQVTCPPSAIRSDASVAAIQTVNFFSSGAHTVDMDTLEACVISFNPSFNSSLSTLVSTYSVYVPRDLSNAKPKELYNHHVIGSGAYNSMCYGRRWHSELFSTGGVSLALANREVLSRGTRPLLLLEDDHEVTHLCELRRELRVLSKLKYDLAVFGAVLQGGKPMNALQPIDRLPGWYRLTPGNAFFLTHAVLYSAAGRRKNAWCISMHGDLSWLAFAPWQQCRQW